MSKLFIHNKYLRIYNQIVARAQSRTLNAPFEIHHIIPKSLGGSNDKKNLVKLTLREHFICHRLLTKFLKGKPKSKMIFALNMMLNRNHYHISSRTYDYVKNAVRIQIGNLSRGRKHSQETKDKIRNKMIGRKVSTETREKQSLSLLGHNVSDETKEKIRTSLKGRKGFFGEENGMFGKEHTDSTKKKMSEAQSGEKNHFFGKKHSEKAKEKLSQSRSGTKRVYREDGSYYYVKP